MIFVYLRIFKVIRDREKYLMENSSKIFSQNTNQRSSIQLKGINSTKNSVKSDKIELRIYTNKKKVSNQGIEKKNSIDISDKSMFKIF
jgi:hypothetical protein